MQDRERWRGIVGEAKNLLRFKWPNRLISSPITNQGKFLSVPAIQPALQSPNSGSRNCNSYKNKLYSPSEGRRSPQALKAARCLFSPQRSPRPSLAKRLYPTSHKSDERTPPSFDTPLRKSMSTASFYTNNKESFILGRGSYGLVVEGRYKNKNIAVKIMSQCQKQDEVLNSEMNALKLNHPNLIKVFQVMVEPDVNIGFVFMELIWSKTLENVLQDQIVKQIDKLRYLKQIGSALQYCHSNSILHLDVKPKNVIVIAEEKTCKLCDFGSSYDQFNTSLINNPRKGTVKYSAPELLKGEHPTEKADVYSFGITMWQTIYQEVPYGIEDLHQVVYKVVKNNYRPMSCSPINSSVHHIYEACWQADPQKRPSMSQVLQMCQK
ncbi:serine/threonine-protein kinase mos-like isoform X1 [Macrosteles quadrilineatus]|uniref:serine/threonine-protein kinase mos-like isoform X1 n=1 Tax=Macrosteles quadrilineatus TaxID=74068 RepID=UPI0023E1EFB9|nr:serine/threonine-protein kinase mos-like isoform X1 [Macrosteles quadrilineatus]